MKTQAIKYLNGLITDETTKKEIDLIDFIKKCVREYKLEDKPNFDAYIDDLYGKFYKMYARKGGKEQGRKTFHKKLCKLKSEEQILEKARAIVILYKKQLSGWVEEGREPQYIPLISSWLNANVPE